MKSWKFTDDEGVLCETYYDSHTDEFIAWDIASVVDGVVFTNFTYDPEEVESLLNRGIWKRLS